MKTKIKNNGLKIAASYFGKKPNSKPSPGLRKGNQGKPSKPNQANYKNVQSQRG